MLEQEFNTALADPAALPHHRFPIYRNNVFAALTGALRVRFSVVEQIVGQDFFTRMAGDFAVHTKPTSAVLIHYGASLAEFIGAYEAAASLPYLGDVAQFENAWWHAYHAAEAVVFDVQQLVCLSPHEWEQLKFQFHPTVQLFKTDHAAVSIWQWHQTKENTAVLCADGTEYAIISRPEMEVEVRLISAEGFTFLQQLVMGQSLQETVAALQRAFPDFDLQTHLAALFQLKLIVGVSK